jgi:hypothetical protein
MQQKVVGEVDWCYYRDVELVAVTVAALAEMTGDGYSLTELRH